MRNQRTLTPFIAFDVRTGNRARNEFFRTRIERVLHEETIRFWCPVINGYIFFSYAFSGNEKKPGTGVYRDDPHTSRSFANNLNESARLRVTL